MEALLYFVCIAYLLILKMNIDNNKNDFYQRINDAIFPLLENVDPTILDLVKNTKTEQPETKIHENKHSRVVKPSLKIAVFPFSYQGNNYLIEPSTNFVYLHDFTITPHIWNQKSISITFIEDPQYDYEKELY